MNKLRVICRILTAILLAIIFVHSLLPPSASGEESSWVTDVVINPVLRAIFHTEISEGLVRKLGHFTEYTALGILLCGSLAFSVKKALLVGFIAAFVDETLQIFFGRGPMIADVWLDLCGVAFGFAAGCCFAVGAIRIENNKGVRAVSSAADAFSQSCRSPLP